MQNTLSNYQGTPSEQSTSGEWDIVMALAKKEHEKQDRLKMAITEAKQNGKEVFNYKKFADSYWRKNAFSKELHGDETESVMQHYMEEYYLDFPEVATIEAFATELEKRDENLGE